jgi:hypothetical protein
MTTEGLPSQKEFAKDMPIYPQTYGYCTFASSGGLEMVIE